jgi:hypothetical protein
MAAALIVEGTKPLLVLPKQKGEAQSQTDDRASEA